MTEKFSHRSRIERPAQAVFDWHKQPRALERLTPPWERVRVLEHTGTIRDGDRVRLESSIFGLRCEWLVEHRDYIEGRQFRDLQLKGPFAYWQHTHRVEPDEATPETACHMIDDVEYELPFGEPGAVFGGPFVKPRLLRMFAYRHRILTQDLDDHPPLTHGRTLSVAVTGASGLIGSALTPLLTTGGHTVKRLVRRHAGYEDEVTWKPKEGVLDTAKLGGIDALVHLAGENILARWTETKKARIRESRVPTTRGLCEAIAKLERKPSVLVAASAIGFYGDRRNETLTEESSRGVGFLPDLCAEWEEATRPAADAGIRVVNLRIGVVLTPRGGALKLMLPAFQSFLGGVVGAGDNWMSWVSIEDLCLLAYRALFDDSLRGPVNAVAPSPVTQREFVRALAAVLGRPAVLPIPDWVVRRATGELGAEALLASQKVLPTRVPADHHWRHPILDAALRQLLGRPEPA